MGRRDSDCRIGLEMLVEDLTKGQTSEVGRVVDRLRLDFEDLHRRGDVPNRDPKAETS
jgi:hypothetical protein